MGEFRRGCGHGGQRRGGSVSGWTDVVIYELFIFHLFGQTRPVCSFIKLALMPQPLLFASVRPVPPGRSRGRPGPPGLPEVKRPGAARCCCTPPGLRLCPVPPAAGTPCGWFLSTWFVR